MGLFDFLTRRSPPAPMAAASNQILVASMALLDNAIALATPHLEERVKTWDLDNSSLLLALGYISGFIDAAYQATRPKRYDERLVNSMYLDAIDRTLHTIEGASAYARVAKSLATLGGSDIGGLQGNPYFMKGTMAGGGDFVNFANEKRPPLSLARLLGS